ncbi:RidA family protein [Nocardiopsis halophila]|uniref:RidA family protein n=1 Tax=Nocardiopsis halophila TaxID=141692 RepID=UPI001F4D1FA1|nr:RidA family protein [Nocardiopsis halophila]
MYKQFMYMHIRQETPMPADTTTGAPAGTAVHGIRKVSTDPDWYAPYRISQAVRAGGFVHVSGQAGIDEQGRTVPGGFLEQGRQAFANLRRVLAAAGADPGDVVKVGIFVRDMRAHLDDVIRLRGEFLSEPYPADTLLEVSSLAQPDWLIEVEATALDR